MSSNGSYGGSGGGGDAGERNIFSHNSVKTTLKVKGKHNLLEFFLI